MRRRIGWLFVGFACVMLLASACSAPRKNPAQDFAAPAAFDCTNPIDILDAPPEDWHAIADVIALPRDTVLQRGRFDQELGRRFSKYGLVMRTDQAFTITVVTKSPPNAVMGWGTNSRVLSTSINVAGCPGTCEPDQPSCPVGETGEWVVYPGGVWTVKPACLTIEIVTATETVSTQLPIGTKCA